MSSVGEKKRWCGRAGEYFHDAALDSLGESFD
jgi:hypothetical protein